MSGITAAGGAFGARDATSGIRPMPTEVMTTGKSSSAACRLPDPVSLVEKPGTALRPLGPARRRRKRPIRPRRLPATHHRPAAGASDRRQRCPDFVNVVRATSAITSEGLPASSMRRTEDLEDCRLPFWTVDYQRRRAATPRKVTSTAWGGGAAITSARCTVMTELSAECIKRCSAPWRRRGQRKRRKHSNRSTRFCRPPGMTTLSILIL